MDAGPDEMRQWSPSMVGTMSVIDRGDAPAQLVIERNLKAQAQRQADHTKEELDRITGRVDKAMAAFELNEELMGDNKAALFVPDLLELEKIISDAIQKRKYQQQVMIFVVGFEEVTGQRLKLLTQINDFFGTYINNIDEEELKPRKPEVDLEEVSVAVQEAMETASSATQKLSEINSEILSYVEKMTGGKAASKSKKKLEKALLQAKEDIMSLTDKLSGAQAEIEDKEDQMTRLYKQIDLKSMEVLKYKNNADQAKKKLEEISNLQAEITERDEEIERLHKALDDSQLSLKQLENSKENSFARLKAAHDDSESKNVTIEKLQHKIQALNVQLGDVWNESQKQFEDTLKTVREDHEDELSRVREQLQARIDELEEEALNQPKTWASDSEDERDLSKSVSRKSSGYLERESEFEMTEVASNATPLSQPREPGWEMESLGDDRELKSSLSSRQSTRKQEPLSRQATDVSIDKPAKPTPPQTPKVLEPPTPKTINKDLDDSSRTKTGTPKRPVRNKSNLEPVHEVLFEEKIPIEDEERWSKVPPEQLPSAFKQYRKEALFIVQGLQHQIKTSQEETHKKIKQLRDHVKDSKEKWDRERHGLIKQVDTAKELQQEAEKEADEAMAQLETFVQEHGETTKKGIKMEHNALKKLTPEQRAKYLGEFNPMDMVKPVQEETNPEHLELFLKLKATGKLKRMSPSAQEALFNSSVGREELREAVSVAISCRDEDGGGFDASGNDSGCVRGSEDTPDILSPPLPLDDFKVVFCRLESTISKNKSVTRATQKTPQRKTPAKHPKKPLRSRQRVGTRAKGKESQKKPSGGMTDEVEDTGRDDGDLAENGEEDMEEEPLVFEDYDEDVIDGEELAEHFENLLASGLDGEDELQQRPLSASSHHSQQSLYEKFRAQLEQRKLEMVERRSRATSMHGSLLTPRSHGSNREPAQSLASTRATTPHGDYPFPDEEDGADVEKKTTADSATHPHPQREQQSATVSFQEQMSLARLSTAGYQGRVSSHLVSRAPSVSESGVSMQETDGEDEDGYYGDGEGEDVARLVATAKSSVGLFLEVEKADMATSPVAYSTSSKSSRHSVESVADHPIVQEYLKTYHHISDFKDNVMKVVNDKEFGAALEQLAEIKTLHFNRDTNVQNQISQMTSNVETFLKEILSVFGTVMTTPEPEPAVSSLMVSRADTGKSRGGLGFQLPSAAAIQEGLEREMTDLTIQSNELVKELRENYDKLKMEASKQQLDYEDKLNNNTVMIMEMQDTIQDLQRELQALGGAKSMSTPSRVSTATASRDLQVEPTIIFSRSDSERNQRALKRGISAQKVSAEEYNEAVRSMEQYTVLPAKRLVHMVRKYTHHTQMKGIEDKVRQSNSIDEEVYTLLEKMEKLQSKRAQRWGEEMDSLTAERNRLAHLLMETLTHIEQESGIFMIKPILSWKGRGFLPHYQSKLGNYQPPKRYLRPLTPEERKGTPFTIVPAPTPANQAGKSRVQTRNSMGSPGGGGGDAHQLYSPMGQAQSGGVPVKGSAVQMVGELPQPMWSMSTSLPSHGGDGMGGGLTGGKLNFMNTPRLLELDVNRLLIGQNTVSAATKALLSGDRLVNAANSSVRSYVTIPRPSTHPVMPNLRPSRPNSSTEAEKGKNPPATPLGPSPLHSAGPHGRTRSEGALHLSQPLPPIKVPSNEKEEEEDADIVETQNTGVRTNEHPSPPQTPPGSSLRNSPALLDDEGDARQLQNASPGHVTKVSLRSTSQSSERDFVS
ncbi:uncharacterized protein [Diadema setosum]|uniref:uncharacterized protein n=1 Tax=Diadema setosum TaxID=31175 RepID=UPI003B3AE875